MASTSFPTESGDYPIRIHHDDVTLGLSGDVVIAGPDAIRFRDLILTHPDFYRRQIVPYLRRRVASFTPDQVWIDARWRIHITNTDMIALANKRIVRVRREAKRPNRRVNGPGSAR